MESERVVKDVEWHIKAQSDDRFVFLGVCEEAVVVSKPSS